MRHDKTVRPCSGWPLMCRGLIGWCRVSPICHPLDITSYLTRCPLNPWIEAVPIPQTGTATEQKKEIGLRVLKVIHDKEWIRLVLLPPISHENISRASQRGWSHFFNRSTSAKQSDLSSFYSAYAIESFWTICSWYFNSYVTCRF